MIPFHSLFAGNRHVAAGPRLSRWCADDCQPVHSAGIAVCLRPHRATLRQKRVAAAGGHGADLRAGRHVGGGGRRLGGATQSVRALAGAGVRGVVRSDAVAAATGRASDPATGGGGQSFVGGGGRRCTATSRCFAPDRRGHRPAVGAVRRADPGPAADRCGAARRQHSNHLFAAGVRRRCRHFPRAGLVAGRQSLHRDETLDWRGRMAASRPWRGDAGRCGSDCPGSGHGDSGAVFHGVDQWYRASAGGETVRQVTA
ncbi:hypothetical protein D3C71_795290 [compost metagenome]